MSFPNESNVLRSVLAKALRDGKPIPPRPMMQWVADELVIPSGRCRGEKFDFDTQPAAKLWFAEIDSGKWTDHVYVGPSQSGKTLTAYVLPLLYHTCEINEPYVLGVPFGAMAADKWTADVEPVLSASPRLAALKPMRGSGAGGGRIKDTVMMANGAMIKLVTAGADDTGKAGFTARVFGITEAARFGRSNATSKEADPLRQIRARQNSYPASEQVAYIEGTGTVKEEMPWSLFPQSSRSRIVSQCPHCDGWVSPGRSHLAGWQDAKTEKEAAAKTHFVCPECTAKITAEQRVQMLHGAKLLHDGQSIDVRGRITGEPPETTRLFFHVTAFANLLRPASDFGLEEWRAAQIPPDSPERDSAERSLCQFIWAIPYTPPKVKAEIVLDAAAIANRRLVLPRGQLPEDTKRVAVGIDLGSTQGWYLVLAERWVEGERRFHVPDYDMFDIPSHDRSIKDAITDALIELYAVLRAGWMVKGTGEVLHAEQVWIDAGYYPDAVYPIVKRLTGYDLAGPVIASLGRGEATMKRSKYSAPKKSGNTVRQIDPAGLWYVERIKRAETLAVIWDTDYSKLQVHQALSLEAGHPGSVTLFAGTSKTHDRLTRHFMNEQLTNVEISGQTVKKWKRTGANHLLDCIAEAKRGLDRAAYLPEISPWHTMPEVLTRAMLDEEVEEDVWVYPD